MYIYVYVESSRTNYGWCPCGHTDVQRKSEAIEESRTGGQSTLRSSKHMHNRMGKRHPERTCPRANHSTATENPVRGPDGPSLPAHATCHTRWSQLGHGRSHRDVCVCVQLKYFALQLSASPEVGREREKARERGRERETETERERERPGPGLGPGPGPGRRTQDSRLRTQDSGLKTQDTYRERGRYMLCKACNRAKRRGAPDRRPQKTGRAICCSLQAAANCTLSFLRPHAFLTPRSSLSSR